MAQFLASGLNGALEYVTRRVSGLAVPLQLGLAQPLIDESSGLKVEGRKAMARFATESAIVVPTHDGVLALAVVKPFGEDEFIQTVDLLKAIKAKVVARPEGAVACKDCVLGAGIGDYLRCTRARGVCLASAWLGAPPQEIRQLSAVQVAVLSELRQSDNPQEREVYEFYAPLVSPFGWVEDTGGPGLAAEDYQREAVRILNVVEARVRAVEPDAPLDVNKSVVMVRKTLLAQAARVLSDQFRSRALIAVIDGSQEGISQDINTEPAPQLNCEANRRHCDTSFDFRAEPNRGCRGDDCSTNDLKCIDLLVGKACSNVPGVDLNCLGQKLDCERLKEQEKAAWAAERALKAAAWKVQRDACEATAGAERVGCETNQGWLNAWGNVKIGHIDGTATITGAQSRFQLTSAEVADDLSDVTLKGDVSGGAHVKATIVFKPGESLQGHVVCQENWGGDLNADVTFKPQPLTLKLRLDVEKSKAQDAVVLRSEAQEVKVTLSPAPGIALLRDTPQAALACLPLGAAVGTGGVGAVLALSLADTFPVPVKEREWRFDKTTIAATGRQIKWRIGSRSIVGVAE